MIRAILKSIYDRAKSPIYILALTLILWGCYSAPVVYPDPAYSYGNGYYWGWQGHFNPYRYYVPHYYYAVPPRTTYVIPHVPLPPPRTREIGRTRGEERKQLPPPKHDNKRQNKGRR